MSVLLVILFISLQITRVYPCGSSISIDEDPHLFDQLFFNVSEEMNETAEVLNDENNLFNAVSLAAIESTTTTTSAPPITTTTANSAPRLFFKPVIRQNVTPKMPFLFSLPEFPKLFGLERTKWMPFGKHADYSPKLMNNPTFRMQVSPPVGWTFCYPECGSGDQALNSEHALDNVQVDVYQAISYALDTLKLGMIQEEQIRIRFAPRNSLLEEFQDGYERKGVKYRVVRGSVRFYYDDKNPGQISENLQDIDVALKSSVSFTESVWKSVANEVANYLTKEKYVIIKNPPKIVSYSIIKQMFFL